MLQTDAGCEGGSYRITDFMPLRNGDLSSLVRVVEGLDGTVDLDMVLKLRFAYGTMPPWCETTERGILARIGPDQVSLDAPVPVTLDRRRRLGDLRAARGGAAVLRAVLRVA